MARVSEPLHDRAQALRYTSGRVADAMVIHQEEPHERSVQTGERCVNHTE
jgi:hypothetical protein